MVMAERDDFPESVKRVLAKRVGYRCTHPECRALTTGPHTEPGKNVSVGVAAHITAAAEGGPRYNSSLTAEERRAADNGIWMCQTHGTLVDRDEARFAESVLRDWKNQAEAEASEAVGKKKEDTKPLTADQLEAITRATRARPTGNLPDRARRLADDIMTDLYGHGWRGGGPKPSEIMIFEEMPSESAPPDKHRDWFHRRSHYFRTACFARVRSVRDEAAHFHGVQIEELNRFLGFEMAMTEDYRSRGDVPSELQPMQIEQVAGWLRELAQTIGTLISAGLEGVYHQICGDWSLGLIHVILMERPLLNA
jgi:hypothetical protein